MSWTESRKLEVLTKEKKPTRSRTDKNLNTLKMVKESNLGDIKWT